ncbi:putative membrane protein [Aequitasia blattaphilus]|uniref:DUF975 family protein n=1 Tax=Aequitasia blattaphilus TaxID=2949332 RepID=A0ABT1EAK7_9FIRM|nr:DUF975 family protein [Aequitasia blattaphilus]MCP1102716.1 DUF975 family protein [Aequitasia blattaphilus]MCR8615356.1 DUF975 family protein [Aequitasia blattaphilus]
MNWNRKNLKSQGKISFKKNYRRYVVICLILLFISGEFVGTYYSLTDTVTTTTDAEDEINRLPLNNSSGVIADFAEGVGTLEKTKDDTVKKFASYHPTRGVLAQFFNGVSATGNLTTGVLNTVNHMVFSSRIGEGIVILISTLLQLMWFLFVGQVLSVGGRRFALESRRYHDTNTERVFLMYHVKRVIKVGLSMLRHTVYLMLWMFTVIGGVIKFYSYYMVPFILAENPDINGKTAIKISRQMMKGYKWKLFILQFSFLGWNILNVLTFGLLGIFYLNPYRLATESEVYMALRRNYIDNNGAFSYLLKDVYLDIPIAQDDTYPADGFEIPSAPARKWLEIDFNRNYTLLHLILIFFIFSMVGWCWEVSLHLLQDGTFVNRGTMFGPWLPIYGSGTVLVLFLLKPFRNRHILTFFLATALCGIIEYSTSYFLERVHHMKWWDYSGYLLNLNGRVCLEGLLVFGLGCYAIIYIAAPIIDNLISKLPRKVLISIALILVCLFCLDSVYSRSHPNTGKGITDYQSQPQKKFYLQETRYS